jgi:hypothetical protein
MVVCCGIGSVAVDGSALMSAFVLWRLLHMLTARGDQQAKASVSATPTDYELLPLHHAVTALGTTVGKCAAHLANRRTSKPVHLLLCLRVVVWGTSSMQHGRSIVVST